MQYVSDALRQMLSSIYQIGERKPSMAVVLTHPITGEEMTIDRVSSVDIDRRYDTAASEFTFIADNTGGWYSPDYHYRKFIGFTDNRGIAAADGNPWPHVIWPNTKVKIYLGYGDELLPVVTGLIDSLTISPDGKKIAVKGRSLYKKIMVETIKPPAKEIVYKNKSVKYIVSDVHTRAGVPIDAQEIYIWGTNEPYIVPELKIERGQTWDSAISDLITSTYARIYSAPDGTSILRPVRNDAEDEPDIVLDEAVTLTDLEYTIEDNEIKTNLIIKCGNVADSFQDNYLRYNVCRGQYREEILEYAWANTREKRRQAALATFRRQKQRMRSVTVANIGNPALEVLDLARVYEHISQTTGKYLIKTLRTTVSESGYFDLMDLEVV